jgi:hypothetical protein
LQLLSGAIGCLRIGFTDRRNRDRDGQDNTIEQIDQSIAAIERCEGNFVALWKECKSKIIKIVGKKRRFRAYFYYNFDALIALRREERKWLLAAHDQLVSTSCSEADDQTPINISVQ